MSVFFKNDVELYVSTVKTGFTLDNTYKIAIAKDINISLNSSTSKGELNRVREIRVPKASYAITDIINEVQMELFTYPKAFTSGTLVSPDELLIESLFGLPVIHIDPNNFRAQTIGTNKLIELFIFIISDNITYLLENAVVEYVSYNFDIKSICTAKWVLKGLKLTPNINMPDIYTDYSSIDSYIKNKLSICTIEHNSIITDLPIISGSLTIKNNLEFVKRRTLDVKVSLPSTHVARNRIITGNLEVYLDNNYNKIGNLLNNILLSTDLIVETGDLMLNIGGKSPNLNIFIQLPYSSLKIPKINIKDVTTSTLEILAKDDGQYNDQEIILEYRR